MGVASEESEYPSSLFRSSELSRPSEHLHLSSTPGEEREFTRKLAIRVKPEMLAEFTSIFEQRIVPFLHRQTGFMDELLLASPGSRDVLALSFWETSADAEAFHSSAYKDLVAVLVPLIEGTPRVGSPDVLHTTLYKGRAAAAMA